MALFQKNVVQKYLKQLNSELISTKHLEFKARLGNTDIEDKIRNYKKEEIEIVECN